MASFVAGPNQFSLLANAFSGAAKGASDFAQLKLKRDQIAEDRRQFDENLEFGFKKLDEQIRQFDIGTEQRERLEQARNELQERLTDKRIAGSIKTAKIAAGPQYARVREQAERRKFEQRLQERNFGLGKTIEAMEQFGADQLFKDWDAATERGEATFTEWNPRANQMARDVAMRLSADGVVTDDDVRIVRQQIDNYRNLKQTHINNMMEIQRVKALSRGAAAGMYGGTPMTGESLTSGIQYNKSLMNVDPTSDRMGQTIRIPNEGWQAGFRASIAASGDPLGSEIIKRFDRVETRLKDASFFLNRTNKDEFLRARKRMDEDLKSLQPLMSRDDFEALSDAFNNELVYREATTEMRRLGSVGIPTWNEVDTMTGEVTAQQAAIQAAAAVAANAPEFDVAAQRASIARQARARLEAQGEAVTPDEVRRAIAEITGTDIERPSGLDLRIAEITAKDIVR